LCCFEKMYGAYFVVWIWIKICSDVSITVYSSSHYDIFLNIKIHFKLAWIGNKTKPIHTVLFTESWLIINFIYYFNTINTYSMGLDKNNFTKRVHFLIPIQWYVIIKSKFSVPITVISMTGDNQHLVLYSLASFLIFFFLSALFVVLYVTFSFGCSIMIVK